MKGVVNMKLSILMDNNTIIDRYFTGEPGLSFLLEEKDTKILFDTAYSDAFLKNAEKMNKNLMDIDYVVLSHGHLDHTWGLEPLSRKFVEAVFENKIDTKKAKLAAHPGVLKEKYMDGNPIGISMSRGFLESVFKLELKKEAFWLSDEIVFLGEIPRKFKYENREPIGVVNNDGAEEDDFLLDDSAIAYRGEEGLTIITGCSHAGICNIVEHAKEVTGVDNVSSIIGGLHLLEAEADVLEKTADYLAEQSLDYLYPCHCTDLKSKIKLSEKINVKEAGSGMELEFD